MLRIEGAGVDRRRRAFLTLLAAIAGAIVLTTPADAIASVSLTASSASVLEGDTYTLSASADAEPGATHIQVFRDGAAYPELTCAIGSLYCKTTVSAAYSGDGDPPDHRYEAFIVTASGRQTTGVTLEVTVGRRPVTVTLTTAGGTSAVGPDQRIDLVARTTYPGWVPYYIEVFDAAHQTPGVDSPLRVCAGQGPCTAISYESPGLHRYVAKVWPGSHVLASSAEYEVYVASEGEKIGPYSALALITELEKKDFCEQLELAPQAGTHVVYDSTLSDQAIACREAKVANGSLARFIKGLGVTLPGVLGIGLTTAPATDDTDPETPPIEVAPFSPVSPPGGELSAAWSSAPIVAAVLAQNPDALADEAPVERERKLKIVTERCMWLAGRAGLVPNDCSRLPVFSSGSDVPEASDHDLAAIGRVPVWTYLLRKGSNQTECGMAQLRATLRSPGGRQAVS